MRTGHHKEKYSMQIIKYRLVPFELGCAFQVLEMDEMQRPNLNDRHYAADGSSMLHVKAGVHPEITPSSVYVRGDEKNSDCKITTMSFTTNEERNAYMKRVHEALREWAERGGFDEAIEERRSRVVEAYKPDPANDFTYALDLVA